MNRIANQACKRMFPELNKSMFGSDLAKAWFDLMGECLPFKLKSERTQELQLITNQVECTYQVRTSVLQQANNNKGQLLIFTDITELKNLQVKLEHQAYYDELTQIYNRRAFFKYCEQDFTKAKKISTPFTIILMDIDYFKGVNDRYGHNVGDQLLVHVVDIVKTELEQVGLFARYGGEEFVLALNGYTLQEAVALANQLRRAVESKHLITADEVITVTLSFGVAEASEDKDITLYQLLNKADKALYLAKQAGRNQVQAYNEGLTFIRMPD
jgi:diguanylate cyclase (GGDEF)-like protein